VDSGDLVNFNRLEKCLTSQWVLSGSATPGLWAPDDTWECDPRGVPAPIGLDLELWEDDECNAFIPPVCFDQYNGGPIDSADLLIGRAQPTYTAGQLASRLPSVGDIAVDRFTLGGPCGHQEPGGSVCGYGWLTPTGPEYSLTVIIRRVDDAPLRAAQE
jgi:hypothetical protein